LREIRLIEDGSSDAFWNMALDEALMELTPTSTLRLYSWKPPAISIGYFQSLHDEVDLDRCRSLGIDVIRRITGGGAVFHDKEVTYSFIMMDYPQDVLKSYKLICGAILEGLKTFGVEGEFAPLNDLVLNGKKFSGNAQTRKRGRILQHGTILLDVDVETMFSILKVPDEKMRDKMISDVKERVTGLDLTSDEVRQALKNGFSEVFDADLVESEVKSDERLLAEEKAKRYASRDWIDRI